MTGRVAGLALAFFIIFGPLSGLIIWSVAERWYWPAALPQKAGWFYWQRVLGGDVWQNFLLGVEIALLVTALGLLLTVPLAYVLARFKMPMKPVILMLFLLPQAFPQLPVFANTAVLLYRWNLAGKVSGVVLIHLVGALVYALWTLVAVYQSIPPELEEAARNLGASRIKTFFTVSLPLALPGIIAGGLLVFLYSLDEFTGTLLVGAPFVVTLPVLMYNTSMGYELQIASVTALLLMLPGLLMLLMMERFLKAEYLSAFGRI
ncbi:ABC transporter permease [Neomoorella glycerini]|uniref:ABC transporter permease n=1 Tax=Neomoorella glycerini TaxID=55779 RepID=UPI0012E15E78|nr:ABC transporter permease subunit [Moorella glycerini]